jgi:ribosome assembly protein YihI (activator of Der GTPase)
MPKSPTQLSLEKLRADGYLAEVVERFVPGANIRKDLWGWVDIDTIEKLISEGKLILK